ncbi:membrane associated rhomboid family serine protease [Streptomyces sp. 1114.5]|uniref:rhomboid family intramembrane serine protease n=1 Tax=unclassified Streptomyces TaxID=2593676 RepID=UPI000BCFC43E|nr:MULTISPECIES: rhomboid family intramembrane serine protease [unclassified Streptomyces]RKT19674.1 membrane associated rhomboid family serine protease [Streptomyces sp. 1114.5]SOB85871.1 Membrane associated serine protease, rhomboid family [Streptomyces sp. 1331.2]
MSPHEIGLYASAAVVVGVGLRTLVVAGAGPDGPAGGGAGAGGAAVGGAAAGGPGEVLAVVRGALARRPWVTIALFAVMAVMAVVQYAVPAAVDDLMRQPGALSDGQWWRAGTALLVQSSGLGQIAFNLPALLVIGAVAETVLGWWRTLAVFLVSGVLAHVVSLAGWSPRGGGDSVAVCGLLGALAVVCLLRGNVRGTVPGPGLKAHWYLLLVPAAAVFLCALRNNHGAGLLVGCLLGLVLVPRASAARDGGTAAA